MRTARWALAALAFSRAQSRPNRTPAPGSPSLRTSLVPLRLMYSMNLSDSNDQIWVTEYDLSNRFTTRAVKQSDNTYRGEFRHDVRFGTSTLPGRAARSHAGAGDLARWNSRAVGPSPSGTGETLQGEARPESQPRQVSKSDGEAFEVPDEKRMPRVEGPRRPRRGRPGAGPRRAN